LKIDVELVTAGTSLHGEVLSSKSCHERRVLYKLFVHIELSKSYRSLQFAFSEKIFRPEFRSLLVPPQELHVMVQVAHQVIHIVLVKVNLTPSLVKEKAYEQAICLAIALTNSSKTVSSSVFLLA
jgi:hypothetical protein